MSLFHSEPAAESKQSRLFLPRTGSFSGEVHLPGSKSIGNRALLLAALSRGETVLKNLPDSDDVEILKRQLPALGITAVRVQGSDREPDEGCRSNGTGRATKKHPLRVTGAGGAFSVRTGRFDVENAGTAFRPLVAVLSAGCGEFTVDGNDQMRRRPIGDLVSALREAGVEIACSAEGTPPVTIRTGGWKSTEFTISGKTSSQFISAILLAAPLCGRRVIVNLPAEPVSRPYLDLTICMMGQFGVRVEREGYLRFVIPEGQQYQSPGSYMIEGDATAATYFLTAGILSGPVRVCGLDESSIQGDIRYLEILRALGGRIKAGKGWIEAEHQGPVHGIRVDMNDMPDAAMTLAVTGLFTDGPVEIHNVENLRVKESERIRGLKTELEKLGASVEERRDGLTVVPPVEIRRAEIETYRDHRMAMAFSLACLRTGVTIIDPSCVNKTYPGYFDDFERICHPLTT